MEFYNFVSCEIKVWVMESHGKAIEKINSFKKMTDELETWS